MQRLSEIDLPALAPGLPRWVVDVGTALFCLGMMVVLRAFIDAVIGAGAAPQALLFPFGLIATLLSSWRAGALTFYGGQLAAWYYVIPPQGFAIADPGDYARLGVAAAAGALTLFIAQMFRDSAKRAGAERAAKLDERELMLRELNHRTNNNFQMVASLLQLQAKRAPDEAARVALNGALSRVISISQAHRNLYAPGYDVARVDMCAYLEDLCRNLAEALFLGEIVTLDCRATRASMERDRAVAIGLVVNELVTNAAKHAFEGEAGCIRVAFESDEAGWKLTVADNGKGLPKDFKKSSTGLGRGLVEAFARQAGGELAVEPGPGAVFVLALKP